MDTLSSLTRMAASCRFRLAISLTMASILGVLGSSKPAPAVALTTRDECRWRRANDEEEVMQEDRPSNEDEKEVIRRRFCENIIVSRKKRSFVHE